MRIRTKSTILFLSLSLIPLMGVGKFAYENGQQAIKKNSGSTLQQLAHARIENAEKRFGDVYKTVKHWSQMSIMQEVFTGDMDAAMQSFLMDISKENRDFTHISVINLQGVVVASTKPEMLEKDFRGTESFNNYISAGNAQASDVHYSDISKAWEITFSFPIKAEFEKDRVVGILLAGWKAQTLSREIQLSTETKRGEKGNHFMLMRNDGLVIAAPEFEQHGVFKVNLIQKGLRSALFASRKHEGYLIERDEHGAESLIGYDYARGQTDFPDLGWSGFVLSNTDIAFAAIERLKAVTFLGGLIIALIVIILSIIASNQMAAPLLNIAQASDKVARGDFQARVAVNSKDEFGQVARSFNAMAENLQKTTVSKTYFESIIITANDAFISMDEEGSIVGWNPAAERAFGWSRQEAEGKPMAQMIIPPQYRDAHLKGLSRFIGTGEGPVIGKTLELSALHRDGHEFPVEITVWALRRNGKYQFNAFVRDVTERKKAETQRNRLATTLHAVQDAAIITDIEGIIEYVNPAFERISGYGAAEAVGRKPNILKSGVQNREFYKTLWETILGGKIWAAVIVNRKKDGTLFTCEQSVIPIKDASGRIVNFAGILHDVTKRQEMENKLLESNRDLIEREKALHSMFRDLQEAHENLKQAQHQLLQSEKLASIGQLAAGVAHEINNPVGFINNNMEILEQYVAGYTKIARLAGRIREIVDQGDLAKAKATAGELAALEKEINLDYILNDTTNLLRHNRDGIERIQKIVMDLRTFAREDKGKMEHVKVEEVIEGILTIVQSEIKYKAKLEKNYGGTPAIECNPQRLGQVFLNLIVNALQAIEGTGTIAIKTYRQGESVCVDVSDTGKGIEEQNLAKVFDPFFTTKPVGQGTGLGLSVSHEIVKKHGGEIKVESKIGSGTTFTVSLPIHQEKKGAS